MPGMTRKTTLLSVGKFDAATLFMVSRSREEGPQRGKGEKAVFGT